MSFVIRKFDYHETLGEKLKAIRRSANLTLSELSAKTKIRKSFLQAFENGTFDRLPDPVYARNYLKVYVQALGADVSYYLKQFELECGTCDFTKNARLPRRRAQAIEFLVASRWVKIFVVLALAFGVMGYIGSQIRAIIAPPELFVYEPLDGFFTQDAIITVAGHAQKGSQVSINETAVLLQEDGSFETQVPLERGLNIISIESKKRYSHSATQYRRVVLKQDGSISFAR